MFHRFFSLAVLAVAAAALFGACQKEDLDGKLLVTTERIHNPSKVAIDGVRSEWVSGDQIRINNSTKTVTVDGNTATIESEGLTSPYYAVYPATLAAGEDLTAGTVTVEIPDLYTYAETGGKQKLDLPMAAYATDSELRFKHLTAALMVRVTNSFGTDMQIHEIKIESDLSQISGSRTVDLSSISAIENQTANDAGVTDRQRQVRMVFPTPLTVASGHRDIMVPVCPVSINNKFTVTVQASCGSTCYTFSHTQQGGAENEDRSLVRNQMGYVPVEMSDGGSHISASTLVNDVASYKAMVAAVNAATSGTLNYTVSGTIDFAGARADSIVIKNAVTLNIKGINNAKLQNLKFLTYVTGSANYCGWITATNASANITVSDITLENVDLSEADDSHLLRAAAFGTIVCGNSNFNNCTARNITFPTTSAAINKYYAGIIAESRGNCSVNSCCIEQSAALSFTPGSPDFTFGGIIGQAGNGSSHVSTITNCHAKINNITLSSTAYAYVGGIAGSTRYNTTVSNCTVENYSADGNIALSLNTPSDRYNNVGGLCGYAYNQNLQTFSNNICHVDLTEHKTNSSTTYVGLLFGTIDNGTSGSANKLAGTGNSAAGSSLTLTGTGTNTKYGTGAYLYLVGTITTPNSGLPDGFYTGSAPTFIPRS